jgi:predicted restriction endonuclease
MASLCKLHHAAFDRYILGIRPDLVVDLRLDVLREADGPMLQHGLQGFQGVRIAVPHEARLQPNRDWLAERYESSRERARHVTLCVVHSASNRRWAPVDSTGAAMAALRP